MADDLLTTLGNRLHESQTRLAYYLMTVNASAVALTLGRIEAAASDRVFALLILSVASWVVAFYLGIRHLEMKNGVIVANVQAEKIKQGTHEKLPAGSPLEGEAVARLIAKGESFNTQATTAIGWQGPLMMLGAALYIAWLVAEKYAKAP